MDKILTIWKTLDDFENLPKFGSKCRIDFQYFDSVSDDDVSRVIKNSVHHLSNWPNAIKID